MRTSPFGSACPRLLAMVALAALMAPAAQAQTTLRWKFQKGETLNYSMSQKTIMKVSANNQNIQSTMSQVIDTTWVVKDVANDQAEIAYTFDRIRTTIEQPNIAQTQNKVEYDSKDGKLPEGPIGQVLGPLLTSLTGAEITMKIDGRGEVSDVKLPQKVLDAMKQVPGAGSEGMFSEEGLKKMITQSTLPLPAGPVSKGQTWHRKTEVPTPPIGAMVLDNTYTYQGTDDRASNLERIDVTVQTDLQAKEGSPIKVKVNSQDARGMFLFDKAKGHLSESTLTQKVELMVTVQGMEIKQDNETTATMKLGKGS
jgi:hypothetical protein